MTYTPPDWLNYDGQRILGKYRVIHSLSVNSHLVQK